MTLSPILRDMPIAPVLLLTMATTTIVHAQSAPAPAFKVGDRWVYNVKSGVGINPMTYQETREVTSVGSGGAKIKITGKTINGQDFTRVDEYSGPGTLRYGAPCADEAYRFPNGLQRASGHGSSLRIRSRGRPFAATTSTSSNGSRKDPDAGYQRMRRCIVVVLPVRTGT